MNQSAALAERHWRRWLPNRVAELEDPSSFFSMLGDEVATRIADLTDELEGTRRPDRQAPIRLDG